LHLELHIVVILVGIGRLVRGSARTEMGLAIGSASGEV